MFYYLYQQLCGTAADYVPITSICVRHASQNHLSILNLGFVLNDHAVYHITQEPL
jgi:hypothetical protein